MSSCVRHDWDDETPRHLNEKELYPKIETTKQHKCCTKGLMLKLIELIDLSPRIHTSEVDREKYNQLRSELITLLS